MINFEDVMEKDWSFLEHPDSSAEHKQKIDEIISAGEITETSKVMIAISSDEFVDRVLESSICKQLLVVHDSLFMLACIKEKYDKVMCWQGEVIYIPEKWTPFDVVFLYFLPALPFELDQILDALRKCCSPGARVVISHPQGRQMVEEQQKQYPDVVVSNLPEKMLLQNVAAHHSFDIVGGRNSMYVKVKMEGVPIGRKVDLRLYHSYQLFTQNLLQMFARYQNSGKNSTRFTILYQDREGDWMLAGDVPWKTFVETVQRIEIQKNEK